MAMMALRAGVLFLEGRLLMMVMMVKVVKMVKMIARKRRGKAEVYSP